MKKILIFHPYLAPYRIDLYNELSKTLTVNVLLTGGDKELATLAYDLQTVNQQADFSYRYFSKGLIIGRHLISTIYYKVIKSFKPDIVLAHELGINTLFAIVLKPVYRYKLFVTIDDSMNMVKAYRGFRKLLRRFVISHANGLVVVNPQVKTFLTEKFRKQSCRYHYLPIIQDERILSDKLHDALPLSQHIFKQYTFRGKKVIIFIGRFIEAKAPHLLLKVFSELYENNRDLRLVFIGAGILEEKLREYTSSHNLNEMVFFTGRLTGKELYAWYNLGQVLVLPSRHEPFGAVINEALIAGCKVVASDSVGASCLLDKNNGLVFETNNRDSLKSSLSQILLHTSPITDVCVRNCNMNTSFSTTTQEFLEFINS